MRATPAVSVDAVSKRFRLYSERNQSLKAWAMRRHRAGYEEFWAVHDVSFQVPQGATFGLIGPNGSGKSTLLKCMARILRPDSGSITTRGKVSALLELGAGFHPELSGRDNVYLNGSILGLTKRELDRRFDEIVGFAGLERFIDTPVKNYSSGMYVRLGFSVAINVDPDILLVDEVLAVGDESFQRRCMERFQALKQAGKTIVIVTHALESVRNICDQAALIEGGELRHAGTPKQVIERYMDDIMVGRTADGEFGSRWGSGEARIESVDALGPEGELLYPLRTGDEVIFRLRYNAEEAVAKPVFSLAFSTLNGVLITGPNTREHDFTLDRIKGRGYVDFHVPRLGLLPGTYDVSASLWDYTISRTFDARERFKRIDVTDGEPAEHHGIVALGGRWET